MRNPALQKHHFLEIDAIVQTELSKMPQFTLGVLLDLENILGLKEDIQSVSNSATQEVCRLRFL